MARLPNLGVFSGFITLLQTKLLGQVLYYVLTTGAGQQTLGDKYCDITQVAGPFGLSPTPVRRALFIIYQSAVPCIAERFSSRVASRGIALNDSLSDELFGYEAAGSSHAQTPVLIDVSPSSTSVSTLSRLRQKIKELWLYAIQRWPSMLPFVREFLQLVLRTNLMFFYFEGGTWSLLRLMDVCKVSAKWIPIFFHFFLLLWNAFDKQGSRLWAPPELNGQLMSRQRQEQELHIIFEDCTTKKKEFVEEVLTMIELDDIKDALVGFPGVNGISYEQRKRIYIDSMEDATLSGRQLLPLYVTLEKNWRPCKK